MKYPLWNLCQVSILRYTVLVVRLLTTRRMSVFMLLSFLSCLILSDLASAEPDIAVSRAIPTNRTMDRRTIGALRPCVDDASASAVARRCRPAGRFIPGPPSDP